MRILALDTATEGCSVALLQSGPGASATWEVRELEPGRGASELILPLVQSVLTEAGLELKALSGIAFGRGPGGFTGVRLAASVAQGLAFGAGLPVVPVSDLLAVAQQLFDEIPTARGVVVCNDARMREVYWTCCERDPGGLARLVSPERVSAMDMVQWPRALTAEAQVYGAGRGFTAYPELAQRLGPGLAGIRAQMLPRAREIAWLAQAQLEAGEGVAAEQALPVYLRNDVAKTAKPK